MADVNQSVQISYDADIQGLIDQLKRIPGISKAEAQKMVSGMKKGLSDTEKAAKKAANSTDKSMKKMARSAKNAGKSFAKLKKGTSQISRGLGELSMIAGGTDSNFGRMVDTMAIAGLSASALIPLVAGITAAVAAVGAAAVVATGGLALIGVGIGLMVSETMGAAEAQKKQKEELEKLNLEFEKYSTELDKAIENSVQFAEKTRASKEEITGLMDEIEREKIRIQAEIDPNAIADLVALDEKLAFKEIDKRVKTSLDKHSQTLKEKLANDEKLLEQAKIKADKAFELLKPMEQFAIELEWGDPKESKEFLKAVQGRMGHIEHGLQGNVSLARASTGQLRDSLNQVDKLQEIVNESLKERTDHTRNIAKQEKSITDQMKENFQMLKEVLGIQKALEDEEEKKRKNREWWVKNQARLKSMQEKLLAVEQIREKIRFDGLEAREKIIASNKKELEALEEIKEEHDKIKRKKEEELDITLAKADLEMKLKEELAEFDEKQAEELANLAKQREKAAQDLIDEEEKVMKTREEGIKQVFSSLQTWSSSTLEILKNVGAEQSAAADTLFRIQQAGSMATLMMEVHAQMGIALAKYGPVLGPIAAGVIAAAGAAQAGAIMSQPPPSAAAHMGGVQAAPDERVIRVLPGEAVLDRRTTRRLGGESGIRALQAGGGTGDNVVIISPFKHFDRYNRSAKRMRPSKASGSKGY